MKSPHLINKSSLSRAMNKGYEGMVQAYQYYGLGQPTIEMIRFYQHQRQRILSGVTNDFEKQADLKVREYECLIKLIEAIRSHPDHAEPGQVRDIYTQLSEVVWKYLYLQFNSAVERII